MSCSRPVPGSSSSSCGSRPRVRSTSPSRLHTTPCGLRGPRRRSRAEPDVVPARHGGLGPGPGAEGGRRLAACGRARPASPRTSSSCSRSSPGDPRPRRWADTGSGWDRNLRRDSARGRGQPAGDGADAAAVRGAVRDAGRLRDGPFARAGGEHAARRARADLHGGARRNTTRW
jgi:hypothetical protein